MIDSAAEDNELSTEIALLGGELPAEIVLFGSEWNEISGKPKTLAVMGKLSSELIVSHEADGLSVLWQSGDYVFMARDEV